MTLFESPSTASQHVDALFPGCLSTLCFGNQQSVETVTLKCVLSHSKVAHCAVISVDVLQRFDTMSYSLNQ